MVVKVTKEKYIAPRRDLNPPRLYPEGGRPGYSPSVEEIAFFTKEFNEELEKPDCLILHQFTNKRRVDDTTLEEWGKIYPPLKETLKYGKRIIGDRREMLGLQGKIDRAIVMKTMPLYSSEIRKLIKWEASLKAKTDNENTKTVVVLERYPDSSKVPDKV